MISIITATQDHNEILNVELLQNELKDRIMLWLMMVVGVGFRIEGVWNQDGDWNRV